MVDDLMRFLKVQPFTPKKTKPYYCLMTDEMSKSDEIIGFRGEDFIQRGERVKCQIITDIVTLHTSFFWRGHFMRLCNYQYQELNILILSVF